MKHLILLFSGFFTFVQLAFGRSIPLAKGGVLPIPDQAVVSPAGITFVRPGEPAPVTLTWQNVDLQKLAKSNAEIEAARQKALLTGDKTVLAPEPQKPSPYAELLNIPVKVTFRSKETHQTKVESSAMTTSVPVIDPNTGLPSPPLASLGQSQRVLNTATTTRSDTTLNLTRPPLDTNVAGFLELISDYTQSASGNLIRELREQPDVFTNILSSLRELQSQFPSDPLLQTTAEAIQKLAKNGPVAVDSQRNLARALSQLRQRADARP